MAAIGIPQNFETGGWSQTITGDGIISVSQEILTTESGAGSGAAFMNYRMFAVPGATYKANVTARRLDGFENENGPFIGFVYQLTGRVRSKTLIEGSEWGEYELLWQCPRNTGYGTSLTLLLGVDTSSAGVGEFTRPTISVSGGVDCQPQIIARGLVSFNGETPVIDPTYRSFGIKSLLWDGPSQELRIYPEQNQIIGGMYPIINCNLVASTSRPTYVAKPMKWNSSGDYVPIKFLNTSNGTWGTPINGLAVYVNVEC